MEFSLQKPIGCPARAKVLLKVCAKRWNCSLYKLPDLCGILSRPGFWVLRHPCSELGPLDLTEGVAKFK